MKKGDITAKQEVKTLEDTLAERGSNYGSYEQHAEITQSLKDVMHDTPNWEQLPPYMKESLEMMAHKTARILNGDHLYKDSWHDIVGYIKLVDDKL